MESNERIQTMRKVTSFLVLLLVFIPACTLPFIAMDRYNELKTQFDANLAMGNQNVELCQQVIDKLSMCMDTLEQCLKIAVPDYVSPEQPKTQDL